MSRQTFSTDNFISENSLLAQLIQSTMWTIVINLYPRSSSYLVGSSSFFFGGVHVAHLSSFSVVFLFCLSSFRVLCPIYCPFLIASPIFSIVHLTSYCKQFGQIKRNYTELFLTWTVLEFFLVPIHIWTWSP